MYSHCSGGHGLTLFGVAVSKRRGSIVHGLHLGGSLRKLHHQTLDLLEPEARRRIDGQIVTWSTVSSAVRCPSVVSIFPAAVNGVSVVVTVAVVVATTVVLAALCGRQRAISANNSVRTILSTAISSALYRGVGQNEDKDTP